MFCKNPRKPIAIFKGDDTDFEGNRKLYIDIESFGDLNVKEIIFSFLGVRKSFDTLPTNQRLEISFDREETDKFPLGTSFATLTAIDFNNRARTLDNRIAILVTNNVALAYCGDDDKLISIKVGTINADIVPPNEEAQAGQAADAKATYEALHALDDKISSGGGSVSSLVINTTYAELKAWRNSGTLTPGMQYRITDFVTTANGVRSPYTGGIWSDNVVRFTSAGHAFDIVVTATGKNTIDSQARAMLHDGDTYFAGENLNAWKIWYSLDEGRWYWEEPYASSYRGSITRMIDEHGNDLPYDFKNILKNGQYTFIDTHSHNSMEDGTINTGFVWFVDNVVRSPYGDDYGFVVIEFRSTGGFTSSNTINRHKSDLRIVNSSNIYTADGAINLDVNGSHYCSIGNNSSELTISECNNITIGNNAYYFGIGQCSDITIKDSCSNLFLDNVKRSSFGFGCDTIYLRNGRQVTVGNNCQYISFGTSNITTDLYPIWNAIIEDNVAQITFSGKPASASALMNFTIKSGVGGKNIVASATNKLYSNENTTIRPTGSYTLNV